MYTNGIGRMPAEPNGAAETRPTRASPGSLPCSFTTPGRYGARWARTATGPTPGPPPPCGMQKVLCRFRWDTFRAELARLRHANHRVHVGAVQVDLGRRPCGPDRRSRSRLLRTRRGVDGYVIISAASLSPTCSILARKSARSTFAVGVGRHHPPRPCRASWAEAGLVPCAEDGIRQMLRWCWPLAW